MRLIPAPAALGVLLLLTACDGCRGGRTASTPGTGGRSAASSRPAVTVTMAYGSEKKTWLDEQIQRFLATAPRTAA